eukprot:7337198-Prorocentrum_lima.AAC.1
MTSSLLGSEMCIRDRVGIVGCGCGGRRCSWGGHCRSRRGRSGLDREKVCLLYTSDAADDM